MPRSLERLLIHPVVLLSLGLWALNDHYLKGALHNALTGKLSDVTSLIAGPALLSFGSAALGVGRRHPNGLLAAWCLILAAVMAAINLWSPAAHAYRDGLALAQWPFRCALALKRLPLAPVSLTMDPGDVWTLPAAVVPLWLLHRGAPTPCAPGRDGRQAGRQPTHEVDAASSC